MIEKELKYIVALKEISSFLNNSDYTSEISQSYFQNKKVAKIIDIFKLKVPDKISHVSARLRKENLEDETHYILSIKGNFPGENASDRFEEELDLEREEYEKLLKEADAGTIIKTRYHFLIGINAYPAKLTIDVFHYIAKKELEWEYAMIEIEYENDGVKDALRKNKHDLEILKKAREVTDLPQFTNQVLARELPTLP